MVDVEVVVGAEQDPRPLQPRPRVWPVHASGLVKTKTESPVGVAVITTCTSAKGIPVRAGLASALD